MKEWLIAVTELTVVAIDAMALFVIIVGTVEAFVAGVRMLHSREGTGFEWREVWLRYARTLVAALTFQLAADIIGTAVTSDLTAVWHLGAVAVIRTFLNYFLERDVAEVRELQQRETAVRIQDVERVAE
jgi:uncharacterized membrane protein